MSAGSILPRARGSAAPPVFDHVVLVEKSVESA
jgi:hypothetical protein